MPPKPRATTRKTTTRTRKPAPPKSGVLQLDRPENQEQIDAMIADREPLFSVGGVEYTIPRQVPAGWSMQAFDIAITQGEKAALAWSVAIMLGDEGYAALKNCATLTREDLAVVFNAIVDRVMPGGAFNAPKAP